MLNSYFIALNWSRLFSVLEGSVTIIVSLCHRNEVKKLSVGAFFSVRRQIDQLSTAIQFLQENPTLRSLIADCHCEHMPHFPIVTFDQNKARALG